MLFKKNTRLETTIDSGEAVDSKIGDKEIGMPRHVAIILDGNGRWAQAQGKPRIFGHQAGMFNVEHIAEVAASRGIEAMTLYAFSTENWKRAAEEVAFLMRLPVKFFDRFAPTLMRLNIKTQVIGNVAELPDALQQAIVRIEEMTKDNTGMTLLIALNYGSQIELTNMVKDVAKKVSDGVLAVEDIDGTVVEQHLLTKGLPPVDLLIRTSGEQRISNFLLWQIAYAELYFTDTPWPEFKEDAFDAAIESFRQRDRRFGGVKKR